MKLEGPEHYRITIQPVGSFAIEDSSGDTRFHGNATSGLRKLYVVSTAGMPIYVGVTKQSMRTRLRIGWNATGESGYHGYQWRHEYTEVGLDVWYQVEPPPVDTSQEIETVEAEVVFLIRQHHQWPASQTEIHFHKSTREHRRLAEMVWSHYQRT